MTLINGTVRDVSGGLIDGVLQMRAASYRGDGTLVTSTDVAIFNIVGGALSVNAAPGLTYFMLRVGGVSHTWVADVPNVPQVGLGTILEGV